MSRGDGLRQYTQCWVVGGRGLGNTHSVGW